MTQEERSAFALVEASARMDPTADCGDCFATQPWQRVRSDSKVTHVLEWVKRELHD